MTALVRDFSAPCAARHEARSSARSSYGPATFLRRAVPWLSAEDLAAGLDLLAPAGNPEQRALLDALRRALTDWSADPTQRPSPHVPPATLASPTPDAGAAWLESALAWR